MVAEFTRAGFNQGLLPQNVDAEESLLGAILLDSEAIGRVVEKLKPEAFYITAHATIYKAALAIHGQGNPVDLMSVTTWLYDHNLLEKVGGQSRLAEILDRTVSSVNVDRYAELILDKFIRRELITAGNEIVRFGYESFRGLNEILTEAKDKLSVLTGSPLLTGEDPDQLAYNKLCLEIQQIELGCADPGMRLWKLQKLAQQYGKSTKQLEALYFMSLLKDENESLLTWKELSDRYGDQTREWLLHGFLPKGVTTVLHAKGGVGKTRLTYDILHTLLTGGSWNGFPSTGRKRAILIQTDESAGDMLDALRRRGYDETLEDCRYKTRWTFEHLPQLLADAQEFKPEVIVIDSITSVSRHSLFSENDVQYAKPILKLKDIAQMLGCTIILIHHSNREGGARGTTAIFNSVSEVWKLERDAEDRATDSTRRLLTIEKSRSRRPTTYRLNFEPEESSWTLSGEVGVDENNPDLPIKERIVEFLLKRSGDRFEAQEIAQEINGSLQRVRLCCAGLAADGIVSTVRKGGRGRGSAALYFIAFDNDRPPDRYNDRDNDRPPQNSDNDRPPDRYRFLSTTGVVADNDRPTAKNTPEKVVGGGTDNDRPIVIGLEPSDTGKNITIGHNDRGGVYNDRPPQPDRYSDESNWTKKLFGAVKERDSQPTNEDLPQPSENDRGAIAFFNPGDRVWWDDDYLAGEYVIESSNGDSARLVGISKTVSIGELTIVERASVDANKFDEPTLGKRDWQIGDRVRILCKCSYQGHAGTIVRYEEVLGWGVAVDQWWLAAGISEAAIDSRQKRATSIWCSSDEIELNEDSEDMADLRRGQSKQAPSEFMSAYEEEMTEIKRKQEEAEEEMEESPDPASPAYSRTNLPKKGDHIRNGSGKAGQISLTRKTNPRYEITWEDGRVMGYDFEDLETLDIRREF